MKVKDVIGRFDALYPNSLPYPEKRRLLYELDGRTAAEVLSAYPCALPVRGDEKDDNRETLIGEPYESVYISFLAAENDALSSDTVKYANSSSLFNETYSAWADTFNREHRAKKRGFINDK